MRVESSDRGCISESCTRLSIQASSGKDRRICIWQRTHTSSDTENGPAFELLAAADSAHKRIIWSIHFCPKRPDILASGSRDGMIKLWHIVGADDGSLEMKEILR